MQKRERVKQTAVMLLTFVMILLFSFAIEPETAHADGVIASGTAGTDISWTLDDKGVLTLTGSGEMPDYSNGCSPWYASRKSVLSAKIGEGITYIGSWAFASCQNMTSAEAAGNISVATFAFYNCTGLQTFTDADGLNNVGYYAFYDCKALTEIPVIKGTMDSSAFYGCSSIKEAVICGGVKSISINAFSGCTGLKSVVLPAGLESIGASAFNNCSSLAEITIPGTVTAIGDSAFAGCGALTEAYYMSSSEDWEKIPSFTGIEAIEAVLHCAKTSGTAGTDIVWSLFDDGLLILSGTGAMPDYTGGGAPWYSLRNSILTVKIDTGITHAGDYAFYDCQKLTAVSLPAGLTSAGSYAFRDCGGLAEITLPKTVSEMGTGIFRGCTQLTVAAIPSAVQTVPAEMFYGCTKLSGVIIPESVTAISDSAFYQCGALTELRFSGTSAEWGSVTIGANNDPLQSKSLTVRYGLSEEAVSADALISAIGDVSYDTACWNKIKAAREQYDALSELDKACVESYSALTDAEAEFAGLEAEDTPCAVLLYSSTTDGRSSVAALSGGICIIRSAAER